MRRPAGSGATRGRAPGGTRGARPNSPYDLYRLGQYETVEDLTAWQLWWEFNKDPYLRFAHINTADSRTGSDDFFLGTGQRDAGRVGGRASRATIQAKVKPALMQAVETGGSLGYVKGAMLAIAKIGGEENARDFEFVLKYFLTDDLVGDTAAVALGVLGSESLYPLLRDVALDTKAGREIVGNDVVGERQRAFAAYGLGLIGQATADADVRRRIVADLVVLLETPGMATEDLKVAAMVAMGLVPLEVVEGTAACYCGECEVADPHTSLQAQVTYLMRYFTAKKEFDTLVRAHTATTLARLIEAQPAGMPAELKMGVAEVLVDSLEKSAREPEVIRESAVLALGLVGDADDDPVDGWIRWALNRAAGHGDPMQKRYALVALAQVGSRPGRGDAPYAGTPSARKDLLHHLAHAKKSVKPWAGLALGVMGFHLHEAGQPLSSDASLALRTALKSSKSASDLGAYGVACGLRRDAKAQALMLAKISAVKDESARAYTALGLGLLGNRASIEPLQTLLASATDAPQLQERAGLALGLLGDTTVAMELVTLLEQTESAETRASIAKALGFIGDQRSIDALVALLTREGVADATRERAVVALGYVADSSLRSWRSALARNTNYRAETPTLTSGERTGILDL